MPGSKARAGEQEAEVQYRRYIMSKFTKRPRKDDDDERNIPKMTFLGVLLIAVFMSTSVILAAYQQHLYIDNRTVIDATVGFKDNRTVNIRGNMVQYGQDAIIPINRKEYIRITGNQIQMGDNLFTPAVRQVTAKIYQNILFEQKVGEFSITKAAQVGIEGKVIAFIPISANIVNIRSTDSNYNVEFTQDMSYLTTTDDVMLKLQKEDKKIKISIIGLMNYDNVWMRII